MPGIRPFLNKNHKFLTHFLFSFFVSLTIFGSGALFLYSKPTLKVNRETQGKVLGKLTPSVFDFGVHMRSVFKKPVTFEDTAEFQAAVTFDDTIGVAGLATLAGGFSSTTGSMSVLNFVGTGSITNLQTIDTTTKTTLEETLELSGDVDGTLDDVTIQSIGGVDVGDIEDSDGNVVYIDGGEMVSGDITDLDTESITKIGTIDTGVWPGGTDTSQRKCTPSSARDTSARISSTG